MPATSRVFFSALLTLLLLLAASGCADELALESLPAPVKLGLVVPVAGPEQAAATRMIQAVRLAVEQRNARGGAAGHPVELVIHDDHAPDGGADAARWLVADPAVLGVLGHPRALSTAAAAPTYRTAGVAAVLLGPADLPTN